MSNHWARQVGALLAWFYFARLDFPVFAGTLPSRQRPGPPPANRDVLGRTVRKSRPPFAKQVKFWTNIVSMEFAFFASFFFFLSFFFFFFSFLHFLETGKVKPLPPPPNGHTRILANAEIYGRSLIFDIFGGQFKGFTKTKKTP